MIITQTPLRISFLGGNTDFPEYYLKHGGRVLTATIDKYIYCIVKEKFDDHVIVNYSIKEIVSNVDDLKHGLVREALKLVGITKSIEVSFLGDIPSQGTGLGSSSSVAVGALNALHAYLGEYVSSQQLAKEAVHIEVDILKKPIGVQDQYAVAFGGLRVFEFKAGSGEVDVQKIKISDFLREDFNNSLMLFYTGITRKADEILSSFNVSENKKVLDQKKILVNDGVANLVNGNLRGFGHLLKGSWSMKKKSSSNTVNNEIDSMYQKALNAGAIGGKLIGAGGGGFLLVIFPANKRVRVREALRGYKELPIRFNNFGSRIILNI